MWGRTVCSTNSFYLPYRSIIAGSNPATSTEEKLKTPSVWRGFYYVKLIQVLAHISIVLPRILLPSQSFLPSFERNFLDKKSKITKS